MSRASVGFHVTRSLAAVATIAVSFWGPSDAEAKPRPARKSYYGATKTLCKDVTLQFPAVDAYPLLPVNGDRDLNGRQDLKISVAVRHTATRVRLLGRVTLQERPGLNVFVTSDATEFVRHFERTRRLDQPGCRIAGLSSTEGTLEDDGGDHHWVTLQGTGLVTSARCRQDTSGSDEGEVGCKDIRFRPITVDLEPAPAKPECDTFTVLPTPVSVFPLIRHTRGDSEMGGNRVHIQVESTASHDDDTVQLVTRVELEESRKDWTTFDHVRVSPLFHAPWDAPGCRVVSVDEPTGRVFGTSLRDDHRARSYGSGPRMRGQAEGHLESARCRTDTPGNDGGEIGCADVWYHPLKIRLAPQ